MQAENWKFVKDILFEVLPLEPARQIEYLAKSEMPREVRKEVESLLACSTESEFFMSLSLEQFSEDFLNFSENDSSLAGQKLGNYEIIEEIGFGGMGAVYLANRCDGKFEQKAAIKMLKREFNCPKYREYFRREREIQARLNHPNIARLLDAGTTADGVPFLVMEYIEGVPVDKYCAAQNLSLQARLKLFNRICEAVAFAHRNLIVHRDLKPSNILIGKTGEPKLLDFGISKILTAEDSVESRTVTKVGAMTPEYASPEQIKGETITTATDIYSLGVILFKILTGTLPHNFKNKSNGEILSEITDSEPLRPSSVLQIEQTIEPKKQSANLKSQIPNPKSLRGDLDNIVLKSLSKETTRRYQTVEQFSDDIWRFLDGLPVSARQANAFYRAKKYFQRNKLAVVSASLILISLISGITAALWQAKEANAQAVLAFNAQKQAETEEERAKKISGFMLKIVSFSSPHWSAGGAKYNGETKVIEALNELGGQIDVEFADYPDVQAELHHMFASAYNFKDGDEFRKKERFHTLRSFELTKQIYGENHEMFAKELFSLWNSLPVDDPQQAEILMQGIETMRRINPNNLNLAYMFEAYANRLVRQENLAVANISEKNVRNPSAAEVRETYRKAIFPATDENNHQIAEKMWRESLPIFRLHYKETNRAIYNAECGLSYNLAMQKKWTDFDEHYIVCQQGVAEMQKQKGKNIYDYLTEPIEKMLVEKNPRN